MAMAWDEVWRVGVAPELSTEALAALRDALATDDVRLAQGVTTSPQPSAYTQDWPPDAACGIGLCGWLGEGLGTVGEVEEYFARTCFEIDQRVGEPAGCRWFLNFFDETPRHEMIALLLPEVEAELQRRSAGAA